MGHVVAETHEERPVGGGRGRFLGFPAPVALDFIAFLGSLPSGPSDTLDNRAKTPLREKFGRVLEERDSIDASFVFDSRQHIVDIHILGLGEFQKLDIVCDKRDRFESAVELVSVP
jgi:hypothetical protein